MTRIRKPNSLELNHVVAVFLLCVGMAFLATYLTSPPQSHGATFRPFTVNEVQQMFGNANDPLVTIHATFARRSDGSWSHTYDVKAQDHVPREAVEFLDVSSAIFVHAEPVTRSIMTRHLALAELPDYVRAGVRGCDGSEDKPDLQRSAMLGFDVVRIETKEGSGTELKLVAPMLDCYPLRDVFTAVDGRRTATSVIAIREGEPSSNLFEPPQGYLERSPKEIQALYGQIIPGAKLFDDRQLPALEQRYRRSQDMR